MCCDVLEGFVTQNFAEERSCAEFLMLPFLWNSEKITE